MAQRRDRPSVGRSSDGLNIRLPDGTPMTVPVRGPRAPVASETCCFCGRPVEPSDPEHMRLGARWVEGGTEREQSWEAHRSCLLERMHDGVEARRP